MMSLSIVAARDIGHAAAFLSTKPRKAIKNHTAEETEGIGRFLYDFREAFTNYEWYYRFDPYRDTCLKAEQVLAIKTFSDSVGKWFGEHGYGLAGIGD